MKKALLLAVGLCGCSASQNVGQTLLDASVLGPQLAAARESRMLTEERVSVASYWANNNELIVSGKGTPATSGELLFDRITMEAASKALEAGYRYIIPVRFEDTSFATEYTINHPYETEVTSNTRGHVSGGNYNSNTQAKARTTGGPRSGKVISPAHNVTFRMLEERPNDLRPGQYYDATQVYNHLGRN